MSKGLRLTLGVVATLACVTLLHVWQNIGFDRLKLAWLKGEGRQEEKFFVGFLPVT
ncbi:MAG TPA: hypothetical protein VF762_09940 [Blastocatellia bacterium]|jgi:hypothetical protein